MDNSIKITTRFNANEIRQTITDPLAPSVAEAITERLVDLRDQEVKRALKELGWISPEDRQGMALVPREITAETGHKAGMIGDFTEPTREDCPYCDHMGVRPDGESCEDCGGEGSSLSEHTISWTTIKAIHRRIVEIAKEPQE